MKLKLLFALAALPIAIVAPKLPAQTQIQGPAIIQGGPTVTNNPAGSVNQVQINNGSGGFGAVPVSMDSSGNVGTPGKVSPGSSAPAGPPAIDITNPTFGAVINGSTPIDSALAAGVAAACTGANGTGSVLIPGNNGLGAYLSNGNLTQTNLTACATPSTIHYKLQGKMTLGSTLNTPSPGTFECDGGSMPTQFSFGHPHCQIVAPAVYGTLGAALSANTSTTFTPTFTSGSIANLPVNSAISIADTNATATISSATVKGVGVVATVTAQVRIPAGTKITVTGNTQAAFNTTPILFSSDFVAGQMVWTPQTKNWAANTAFSAGDIVADNTTNCTQWTGVAGKCLHIVTTPGTSGGSQPTWNGTPGGTTTDGGISWTNFDQTSGTGGTVTGFNDDTYESARVTANNGTQITIYTMHAHPATASWGEVAVSPLRGSFTDNTFKGISVTGCYGACFWFEEVTDIRMDGVGASVQQYPSAIPMEMASAYNWHLSHIGLIPTLPQNCFQSCSQTANPCGLRLTNAHNFTDSSALNMVIDGASLIGGCIKVDTNGRAHGLDSGAGAGTKIGFLTLDNVTIEQPNQSGIDIDPRYVLGTGTNFPFTLRNFFLQDNNLGYDPEYIRYTDRSTSASNPGQVIFEPLNANPLGTAKTLGKYYNGQVIVNGYGQQGHAQFPWRPYTPLGSVCDGVTCDMELRGEGANFSPSLIPYATANVTTSPASWTCVGTGCSVTTGIQGPDWQATAGEIVSGSAGNSYVQVYSVTGGTAAGDHILSGVSCIAGTNTNATQSCSRDGAFGAYNLVSFGAFADTFDGLSTSGSAPNNQFTSDWGNDWWKPIVSDNKITNGSATSHTIAMRLYGPQTAGQGNRFWMPFLIYIPYSAKPASMTDQQWDMEISRLRQQLLHGAVPPNMAAGQLGLIHPMALPNGSTAVTQANTDNSTKVATTAFVQGLVSGGGIPGYGRIYTQAPATVSGTGGVAQTTMVASVPTATSQYRMCGMVDVTTAGTAGTFFLRAVFTSDGHSFANNVSQVTATSTFGLVGNCQTFSADSGSTVKWDLLASGVTGTPTVRYAVTLEQLQQ